MFNLTSPTILPKLFPCFTWSMKDKSDKVFLTFDDGPVPGVTRWVLSTLKQFNAKATFFCLGKNVKNNPDLYSEIIENGHSVGNHTFNHLKGWTSTAEEYTDDIKMAEEVIESRIFRPPYGKISPAQVALVRKKFNIIMWDVLTRDYDYKLTGEECLNNATTYIQPGSIVGFHDSYKAEKNLKYALPRTLEHIYNSGLKLSVL